MIANALYELQQTTEGRSVVRDALLSGFDIRPLDLEDETLSELLSEDLPPRWLACLGGIRRLWPLAPPGTRETDGIEEEMGASEPVDDDERALSFWRCLCLTRLGRSLEERLLHMARKRMKRLKTPCRVYERAGRPLTLVDTC